MYDLHFRQSVINYYNKFYTTSNSLIADIENIFSISSATLYNWINLHKKYGTLKSKHIGRPLNSCKFYETIQKYVIKYFTDNKKYNLKS